MITMIMMTMSCCYWLIINHHHMLTTFLLLINPYSRILVIAFPISTPVTSSFSLMKDRSWSPRLNCGRECCFVILTIRLSSFIKHLKLSLMLLFCIVPMLFYLSIHLGGLAGFSLLKFGSSADYPGLKWWDLH